MMIFKLSSIQAAAVVSSDTACVDKETQPVDKTDKSSKPTSAKGLPQFYAV